jgi:predicted nucleotide-binding protein (sugar kinase/HSP70/actin superfamily)
MAEIIDEAVAAGLPERPLIAGIYDSVVQNYLNRVKGNRPVGSVIFCQGMPFSSPAPAAAVASQTGSEIIVPPNPGTVGALGIALLAVQELPAGNGDPLDLGRALEARVEKKETFVCRSSRGCGGTGNRCRIDALTTSVGSARKRFTWGGACSLHERGTRRRTLPDRAPDPFREREALVRSLAERFRRPRGGRRIGLTDEFTLKELFPFFAAFFHALGFDLAVRTGADHADLKRGIEGAHVPFCAPMQLYHGLFAALAGDRPDFLFAPMLRETPRMDGESHAAVCPIAQASPDILRLDLSAGRIPPIVSPVINLGPENLASERFREVCRRLADELGCPGGAWEPAYREGLAEQERFGRERVEIGRRALEFCADNGVVPVVVLGRSYTICNTVLNSNVPALLREQGAVAIPVDCYPLDPSVAVFDPIFWGHGQRSIRAAHQIRRTPGVYGVTCSNYSCGPDSFLLHFYAYAMEGKPFAVIETDGHAGDAGTKTRIEAFLHCVHGDLEAKGDGEPLHDFGRIAVRGSDFPEIRAEGRRLLIPRMGPGAEVLSASLRGVGVAAETLPEPDRETVRVGRRYTSGKECLPLCLTLGGLLQWIERDGGNGAPAAFLMPSTYGPCRLGAYHLLQRLILDRLGQNGRVVLWSPVDRGYFRSLPAGFPALVFSGFMASDLLDEALYDARPAEIRPGAALAVYRRYRRELLELLERAGRRVGLVSSLREIFSGRLFGVANLLRRAAADFRAIRDERPLPTVLVTGEIYVRCDPFANDFVIDRLARLGIRSRFAPFNEWIEYSDFISARVGSAGLGERFSSFLRKRIQARTYRIMAEGLGWPAHVGVQDLMRVATPYLREDLEGEAVLTLGGAIQAWRGGHIDGVVSVGPLECMPNKISEAQFFHVAEREGLQPLTLPLNGDPVNPEVLEAFAFEVKARFRAREEKVPARVSARRP